MADNFSDWYMGSMAPPLRLPGGGYAPAPAVAPSSVEDFYRGIYAPSVGAPSLSSVSRQTVPINPITGMPYATTANASMSGGPGIGYGAQGQVRYSPPVYQPNGTIVENKSQARLPTMPVGMPLTAPLASARGQAGIGGFGSGSLTASMPSKAAPAVISLNSDPMSEVSGQNLANSFGKPVRGPSGKTYYPSNTPMSGVRAPYDPNAAAKYGAPAAPQAPARSGGLFGGLFGGGNGGGLFGPGGLFGGGAPRVAAPAPTVPATYSNGVANPDYRNYSNGTSEGGGLMPANAFGGNGGGGFTDSLGGTYYDRNLK